MPPPRDLDPYASLGSYFGAEIRRLRERLGWTQEQLADELGWSLSTIASVETARRSPPEGFPEKADEVYGLPEVLAHLADLARSAPHWFEQYVEFEARANRISIWSGSLIPGLFQDSEFARAIMVAGRPLDPPEVIGIRLTDRMARQKILDRPDPPQVRAVLHEAAVKQPVRSVEVTRAQLKRLRQTCQRPHVTVQVMPFAAGEHGGMGGPFTIFEFADQPPVGFAEGRGSFGRILDSGEELKLALLAYDQLTATALSPEASMGLITGAMTDIWIDRS